MESDHSPESSPKSLASADIAAVARAMREAGTLSPELRKRFIALRSELFRRGVFDPVLARFDSVTVSRAAVPEIADQLDAIAADITVV
jgi:hypothetical protein